MDKNKTYNRKKCLIVTMCILFAGMALMVRLGFLMIARSQYYLDKAKSIHERERAIKAPRGKIYDRNGVVLASNKPVCSISVIHSQITDAEKVISLLSEKLEIDADLIRKKVEVNSIREKVKSNVDKKTADAIREYALDGVMIDEDYKRYYPYNELGSKVLGFTGADNQGIVGLEVEYEEILKGMSGSINTLTNAYGVEIKNAGETRVEPIAGNNLYISLDVNIQKYAQQAARKVMTAKEAKRVSIIMMNPQNGEIYAMVNVPEYNLNEPYILNYELTEEVTPEKKQDLLNNMWRNVCINDTYEPGSTFKIVTAAAALEEGVVSEKDRFSCPGFRIVEDRKIRCHKVTGHGAEDFRQGIMNSCNPVFIEVGSRVGAKRMYHYYKKFGLFEKTGIDVPGEAGSIMHKLEDIKSVELATMSFGQSFQITPIQLLRAASAVVNGGNLVTPHFGIKVTDENERLIETLEYTIKTDAISKENSDKMKGFLEDVVKEGSGRNAAIDGYRIGGKTATSEKLPRGTAKYISAFLGFAPANNPKIMAIILIDEPVGVYYGGTIAAPVIKEVFENILPYMGIEASYVEEEKKKEEAFISITD